MIQLHHADNLADVSTFYITQIEAKISTLIDKRKKVAQLHLARTQLGGICGLAGSIGTLWSRSRPPSVPRRPWGGLLAVARLTDDTPKKLRIRLEEDPTKCYASESGASLKTVPAAKKEVDLRSYFRKYQQMFSANMEERGCGMIKALLNNPANVTIMTFFSVHQPHNRGNDGYVTSDQTMGHLCWCHQAPC